MWPIGWNGNVFSLLIFLIYSGQMSSVFSSDAFEIYKDPSINQFVGTMFPIERKPLRMSNAYENRGKAMKFERVGDVRNYYSKCMNNSKKSAQEYSVTPDHGNSFWLMSPPADRDQLIGLLTGSKLDESLVRMINAGFEFRNPVEKALIQRDFLQIYHIIYSALPEDPAAAERPKIEKLITSCRLLLKRMLLTEQELKSLRIELSSASSDFSSVDAFETVLDPAMFVRSLSATNSQFIPIDFGDKATIHFKGYNGRSFIRVFIKTPGWDKEQFLKYWDDVFKQYGPVITRVGGIPAVPARTVTVLLRTAGLFLENGEYVDSDIPEELLIRAFKYEKNKVDSESTDDRGTIVRQFVMRRSLLLQKTASLGLREVEKEEAQYTGFFGETPTDANSYNVTTMRMNCIECHSELYYGANTIFSLNHKRPRNEIPPLFLNDRMLECKQQGSGRYILHTKEAEVLFSEKVK